MAMKYIIVNALDVIIFSDNWSHQNMAFNLNIDKKDITSAGFFKITEGGAYCYGESTSLGGIKSDRGDAELINILAGDNF